jgi:hypothetical protein
MMVAKRVESFINSHTMPVLVLALKEGFAEATIGAYTGASMVVEGAQYAMGRLIVQDARPAAKTPSPRLKLCRLICRRGKMVSVLCSIVI